MKKEKIDFAVGGQALIEGIMMRSEHFLVIGTRTREGEIKLKSEAYQMLSQRYKFLNIPVLRGVINFFEMMVVGMKALNYSANESLLEIKPSKEKDAKHNSDSLISVLHMLFTVVFAIGIGLLLFKVLPLLLTEMVSTVSPFIDTHFWAYNSLDGVIKILFFLAYVYLIGLIPDIKRVFQYHGAEHKSIFAYEKEQPLEPKYACKNSRLHPRCGTSFIIIVFIISVIVYTIMPNNPVFLMKLAERIAILPLIAGIAYEFLKFSAKFQNNFLMKLMITPGLWFQRITTKEPDDKQLEVGLKALSEALRLENNLKQNGGKSN